MGKKQNPLVSLRVPPEILRFLKKRSGGGSMGERPLGSVAKECLMRYMALLARGMGEVVALGLSKDEAERALSSLTVPPEAAHLVVEDLAGRLGPEDPLVQKLSSLSPIGRIALADAAERFRQGDRLAVKEIVGAASRGKRSAGKQKARPSPAA